MKLKKFEDEEIWSWRNLKLKKFEVEEIWSWKKLTKFEVKEKVEIWSWNLNLKFEIEDRSLLLKLKLHVFEIWSLNLKKATIRKVGFTTYRGGPYRESRVVVQRFRIQAGAGTGRVALGGGTVRSPRTPQVIIRGTDQ